MNTKYLLSTTLFSLLFLLSLSVQAQNSYQKGLQALNNGLLFEAIPFFEAATKEKSTEEPALLMLTLLNNHLGKDEAGSEYFQRFYANSSDPMPILFALWFENAVIGQGFRKEPFQLDLLKKVQKDPRVLGKLDAAVQYWLGIDALGRADNKDKKRYFERIIAVDDWQVVGPFDNVVNGGYNKDFGVLAHPEPEASFTSKYGAVVSWFVPPMKNNDGYFFERQHFLADNSLIYAQTFVESDREQDVLLKFGYTGSLKVWLNDELLYTQPRYMKTEMDYFQFKCALNKGYNRILVQLGDYQEPSANFTLRFTDLDHAPLDFKVATTAQPYQVSKKTAERLPNFALEGLKKKVKENPDKFIYELLLHKAYARAHELDKAEKILNDLYEQMPKNYLVLRRMVLFSELAGNTTNQNKYYDLFKEAFPNDHDVLSNEISEHYDQGDKEKTKELIEQYFSLYDNKENNIRFKIQLAALDEDLENVLSLTDKFYRNYPQSLDAIQLKYDIEKRYFSNPVKANKILETFLESSYDYNVLNELASNYIAEGKIDKATGLQKRNIELVGMDMSTERVLVNYLSRQTKFKEAIEVCERIIENRPSDHQTLADLGMLYKYTGNDEKALFYTEEALRYFPFSFENNERIREFKGLTVGMDLLPEIDPQEVIATYEAEFEPEKKKSYDIVIDQRAMILYKSKATGIAYSYILRMNDESAIEAWQRLDFTPGYFRDVQIVEAKTIKKDGTKLYAERNGYEVVFTNLEVGDYIYVSVTDKQVNGGKSTLFVSDNYSFNGYSPVYKIQYDLFVEDGLEFKERLINARLEPEVTPVEGFKHYQWVALKPEMLKEEAVVPPYNDIAKRLHLSLDYEWKDIVQWYSDLTSHQAQPDFTIEQLVDQIFQGQEYTEEEKARMIYEFVCKNIQYSSIDFRQSGYVPQRASDIYHSRLGDCKDVSTLYASLARTAGLDVNLVLINTVNNGRKSVVLPSLNFNHCIVKVELNDGPRYLELTEPDLPFGYLNRYHRGAAILEIFNGDIPEDVSLEHLQFNPGYESHVFRESMVTINEDHSFTKNVKSIRTGAEAASACSSYYYLDEKDQKEELKQRIAVAYNSSVTINRFEFERLMPRQDTAVYSYDFVVSSEVMKVGSFRSLRIPFADILAKMNALEVEGERRYDFDFNSYEGTDRYVESMLVELPEKYTFAEIPANVELEFMGSTYKLEFEKIDDQKLRVVRIYDPNIQNIPAKSFPDFKAFMTQIIEAENSFLVFK